MDEENKIQDGEIVEEIKNLENKERKKGKTDLYVELVLFFILGVLIGVTLKTEAAKRITIGYNDYQMKIEKQDYNINQLQSDLTRKQAEEISKAQAEQESENENSGNLENSDLESQPEEETMEEIEVK